MLTPAQINAAKKLLDGGASIEQVAPAIGTTISELSQNMYQINPQVPALVSNNTVGNGGGLGRFGALGAMFSRFGQNLNDPNKPLIGGFNFKLPSFKNIRAKPIIEGGPSIATTANTLSGLYQGLRALSNVNNLSGASSNLDDIKSQVNLSAMGNPMYASYLDTNQKAALRKIQNGTYGNGVGWDGAVEGGAKGLPKAILSAIAGGFTGGVPGAIIGGVGSLVNSGLEGAATAKDRKASELQSLYETLHNAEMDYNSMRRPANLMTSGLQRRYSGQLI